MSKRKRPDNELDYLRHIYNSLDVKQLVRAHRSFDGTPPKKYHIPICGGCNGDLGKYNCLVCGKILCESCLNVCSTIPALFCADHFMSCPVCELACACPNCLVSTADKICSVCSESYGISYSCGCTDEYDNDVCALCEKKMDKLTKELVV